MKDIDEYQKVAAGTMQFDLSSDKGLSVALLGLSGEVGELQTEFKKKLRDGDNYKNFKEKVTEEVGDVFWYLAVIAEMNELSLSEVLTKNLLKVQDRWQDIQNQKQMLLSNSNLNSTYEASERFPDFFCVKFRPKNDSDVLEVFFNDEKFGNELSDNNYVNDYYRFHDVFHFSYVVVLGWSPVVRKFLDKKRRDKPKVDEVEDGGRAAVIDEAIVALVFEYAKVHNYLDGVGGVDYHLLRTIVSLTGHLEVSVCPMKQWEKAIIMGFECWRALVQHNGGVISCDLNDCSMTFSKL